MPIVTVIARHCHTLPRLSYLNVPSTNTRTIFTSLTASPSTHRHSHQALLRHIHPQTLYQIINDVDHYQTFLPYCRESKILQVSPCRTMMEAVLTVGLPIATGSFVEERYVSRVNMTSPTDKTGGEWTVEARSIQSKAFDSLKSRWQLSLVEEKSHAMSTTDDVTVSPSCRVHFEVEIQVSNPLVSLVLDSVLKDVARKQMEAFERRCRER